MCKSHYIEVAQGGVSNRAIHNRCEFSPIWGRFLHVFGVKVLGKCTCALSWNDNATRIYIWQSIWRETRHYQNELFCPVLSHKTILRLLLACSLIIKICEFSFHLVIGQFINKISSMHAISGVKQFPFLFRLVRTQIHSFVLSIISTCTLNYFHFFSHA